MKKDKKIDFNIEIDDSAVQKVLKKLEDEKTELINDLQRTRADFENYRKQIDIQKSNERKTVKLTTVIKILPLLDDISRAISSYKELEPLKKSLEKSMNELGLSKINAEKGVEFNPDLHEAVTMEGDGDKQVIAEVLRPGYFYEGEVLRPAMVKVVGH